MELLLHSQAVDTSGWISNLHSNMELLLRTYHLRHFANYSKFTFQYGATATLKIKAKLQVISKFTFQYGATATIIISYAP